MYFTLSPQLRKTAASHAEGHRVVFRNVGGSKRNRNPQNPSWQKHFVVSRSVDLPTELQCDTFSTDSLLNEQYNNNRISGDDKWSTATHRSDTRCVWTTAVAAAACVCACVCVRTVSVYCALVHQLPTKRHLLIQRRQLFLAMTNVSTLQYEKQSFHSTVRASASVLCGCVKHRR